MREPAAKVKWWWEAKKRERERTEINFIVHVCVCFIVSRVSVVQWKFMFIHSKCKLCYTSAGGCNKVHHYSERWINWVSCLAIVRSCLMRETSQGCGVQGRQMRAKKKRKKTLLIWEWRSGMSERVENCFFFPLLKVDVNVLWLSNGCDSRMSRESSNMTQWLDAAVHLSLHHVHPCKLQRVSNPDRFSRCSCCFFFSVTRQKS